MKRVDASPPARRWPSLIAVGCATRSRRRRRRPPRRPTTITLVTHDSFAVSKSVLRRLHEADRHQGEGPAVRRRRRRAQPGDPHQGSNPLGDVFFGVDNTFLVARARRRRLRRRTRRRRCSTGARRSTSSTRRTASRPIDHGDVCVNYDKQWFAEARSSRCRRRSTTSPSPRTRACSWSRTRRRRRPGSRSCSRPSPRYGDDGWRDYWAKLRGQRREGRRRLGEAYDGDFTQGANQGTYPLVVSYASSPPAAVYYSKPQPTTSPDRHHARLVLPPGRVRRRAQGHRARRPRRASSSTSCCRERFQADIPLQMFVFPVRDGTPLPAGVHEVRRGRRRPADAPAGRDRRAPRRVDRAVDRHRAAVSARSRAPRVGARRCSSLVPLAFLGGVLRLPGRRDRRAAASRPTARSTSTRSREVVTDPALRHIVVVHGVAGDAVDGAHRCWSALPGAYVLARYEFPGRRARARARDRAVRAADRGRRLRVRRRCSAPAARSRASVSTRPSARSCSRTCSSTTRSSCAPSAGCGRTSTRARRRRRGCSAPAGGARSAR